MGRKVSDGKSFTATAPGSEVINDYDLYRIGGWNGCAVGAKTGTQTDRTMAFECDPAAIYSILLPDGIDPDPGEYLFWDTDDATTFQRGDEDLVVAGDALEGQTPCFQVLVSRNSAGYAQGRVMQSFTVDSDADGSLSPQAVPANLTDASGGAVTGGMIAVRNDTVAHAAADAAANDATLAARINGLYAKLVAAGVLTD